MKVPLHRFFMRLPNWIGILILFYIVGMAILSLMVGPPSPTPADQRLTVEQLTAKMKKDEAPQPPSFEHPLGTLTQQRDILDQLVYGAGQALAFSLKAGLISAAIGVLLGSISAYLGGWVNGLVMRFSDGVLAMPLITGYAVLVQSHNVLLLKLFRNSPGSSQAFARLLAFDALLWAIILLNWVPYARIINAMVTSLKESQFIQAARAMGASPWRIILRHLLPNAISPALVMLARDLGWVVILQATIQYAGLGGGSVWGRQLLDGRNWIIGPGGNPFGYWWVWLPGTVLIILYGVGWNLIGDGLNDAFNPRQV